MSSPSWCVTNPSCSGTRSGLEKSIRANWWPVLCSPAKLDKYTTLPRSRGSRPEQMKCPDLTDKIVQNLAVRRPTTWGVDCAEVISSRGIARFVPLLRTVSTPYTQFRICCPCLSPSLVRRCVVIHDAAFKHIQLYS